MRTFFDGCYQKANKSLSRQGSRRSPLESGRTVPGSPCDLSHLIHNATDTACQCPQCCGYNEQIHTAYQSPVEKKGPHGHSVRERVPWPLSQGESCSTLALTGFYWLSNSIYQRRFSFIMLRFASGDYFLQITKERMLLITSYRLTRKKCCKCKGTEE